MKLPFVLAVLFVAHAAYAQVVTDMTADRIKEAITFGATEKNTSKEYRLKGKRGSHAYPGSNNHMSVPTIGIFTTPFLRVAMASSEAKSSYKEFAESDVTPAMIAPELTIVAPAFSIGALKGSGSIDNVKVIVLVLPDGKILQPDHTEAMPENFANAMGATGTGNGQLASFPLTALQEGAEVRIVMSSGTEQKVKLKLEKIR